MNKFHLVHIDFVTDNDGIYVSDDGLNKIKNGIKQDAKAVEITAYYGEDESNEQVTNEIILFLDRIIMIEPNVEL